MLDPPYRWYTHDGGAYLDYNAGNVAAVKPRDGRFVTVIRFQGHVHEAPCGSVEQGVRWVTRWIEKRTIWPGRRKVRWYDRVGAAQKLHSRK